MRSSSIFINPKLLETRDRMPSPPSPSCRFHWVISVSCVAPFGRRNILGKHASYHTTRDTMMASRNHIFSKISPTKCSAVIYEAHQLFQCTCIMSYLGLLPFENQQDHLRMNVSPDLNNHLRSIDHFRSMIIKKNRSKVRDSHWIVIG